MTISKKKIDSYKSNYLSNVIFRIDFDQVELSPIKEFSKKIAESFPISEESKIKEGTFNFDLSNDRIEQKIIPMTAWVFHNKSRNKKIEIHPKDLVIEYSEYTNSKELLKDIDLVSTFIADFKVTTINRLGLRYVNEINLEEKEYLDWTKYISEDLLGTLKFALRNRKTLSRAMGQICIKEKEDVNININYGIWNQNFPNEIIEKTFVLDFDAYSRFPISGEAGLPEIVKEYNRSIEELFEGFIQDGLRVKLRKKKVSKK